MKELTFEKAFEQLEEAVQRLEAGDLSLAEALSLFEQGNQLAQHCEKQLNDAQLRVSQIVSAGASTLTAVPFEDWSEE